MNKILNNVNRQFIGIKLNISKEQFDSHCQDTFSFIGINLRFSNLLVKQPINCGIVFIDYKHKRYFSGQLVEIIQKDNPSFPILAKYTPNYYNADNMHSLIVVKQLRELPSKDIDELLKEEDLYKFSKSPRANRKYFNLEELA